MLPNQATNRQWLTWHTDHQRWSTSSRQTIQSPLVRATTQATTYGTPGLSLPPLPGGYRRDYDARPNQEVRSSQSPRLVQRDGPDLVRISDDTDSGNSRSSGNTSVDNVSDKCDAGTVLAPDSRENEPPTARLCSDGDQGCKSGHKSYYVNWCRVFRRESLSLPFGAFDKLVFAVSLERWVAWPTGVTSVVSVPKS